MLKNAKIQELPRTLPQPGHYPWTPTGNGSPWRPPAPPAVNIFLWSSPLPITSLPFRPTCYYNNEYIVED